jgi:uncharacterized RDD family membrane protein YckC
MIRTGLAVDSPEGATFRYELASLTDRAKAYGMDLLIRFAVMIVIGIVFVIALGPAMLAGVGLWLIIYFAVEWGYYVLFELWWNGQSPGKRIFDLRVVKVGGEPIGFFESVLRNLLRAADGMPPLWFFGSYASGSLAMLLTKRFQRFGDLAAGTVVILERKSWYSGVASRPARRSAASPGAASAGPGQPPFGPPVGEAQLRGLRLSNRELQMLADFVERKERLHPERREELAQILAASYAQRFGLELGGDATAFLTRLHAGAARREADPSQLPGVSR